MEMGRLPKHVMFGEIRVCGGCIHLQQESEILDQLCCEKHDEISHRTGWMDYNSGGGGGGMVREYGGGGKVIYERLEPK